MIKVFAKTDSQFNHMEIGQARALFIDGDDHSQVVSEIHLAGWQVPDPKETYGIRPFLNDVSTVDEIDNLKRLLAVLVRMLGGSVVILPHEVRAINNDLFEVSLQEDPTMFILKVKERN